MIVDLYRYTDWANQRIFELADGLTDEQLDAPHPIGLGSLRAVLFHIWAADQIWLERWQEQPWRGFPIDSGGISLADLWAQYQQVSRDRWQLLEQQQAAIATRHVRYLDMRKTEHTNRWFDLLLHVANHGIHHRAQVLQYLKRLGRTVPGGLDYLFYKIAVPSVVAPPESATQLKQMGLRVAEAEGRQVSWNRAAWQDYFAYGDWALAQLRPLIESLDASASQQNFQMGVGSIHKTVCHLRDAERWWLSIWNQRDEPFPRYEAEQPWSEVFASYEQVARERDQMIAELDADGAARVVIATPAKTRVPFRVAESMLQLCGHGTHHRSQLSNMLRQLGITAPPLDLVVWARQLKRS